jgi:hypothetical protein
MTGRTGRLAVMGVMSKKASVVSVVCLGILLGSAMAQGELRFCLRSEPKTFDPLKVEEACCCG